MAFRLFCLLCERDNLVCQQYPVFKIGEQFSLLKYVSFPQDVLCVVLHIRVHVSGALHAYNTQIWDAFEVALVASDKRSMSKESSCCNGSIGESDLYVSTNGSRNPGEVAIKGNRGEVLLKKLLCSDSFLACPMREGKYFGFRNGGKKKR